jgi:hemoglobin
MMSVKTAPGGATATRAPRDYGLPLGEYRALPDADAAGITEEIIRDVVSEFYRRVRDDDRLGPVFEARIHDWDAHLVRMVDFWSAALLRSGRYSGRPVQAHRAIPGIAAADFDRWIELFERTVHDLCPTGQAEAFLVRALRMRNGMIMVLGLGPGLGEESPMGPVD